MIPNINTSLEGYRNPDEWKHGHPQKWLSLDLSGHGYIDQIGTPANGFKWIVLGPAVKIVFLQLGIELRHKEPHDIQISRVAFDEDWPRACSHCPAALQESAVKIRLPVSMMLHRCRKIPKMEKVRLGDSSPCIFNSPSCSIGCIDGCSRRYDQWKRNVSSNLLPLESLHATPPKKSQFDK